MRVLANRAGRALLLLLTAVVLAAVSIAFALIVTPTQPVTTAGETVRVGATAPSLTFSGSGELDLFGQRLPTTARFAGPIRPRLVLAHITLSRQLTSLFVGGKARGSADSIGRALAHGWTRYFAWETAVVAGIGLVLIGAVAGWRRIPWRRTAVLAVLGVVFIEAVNLGAVMVTAYSAPATLRQVRSLGALVGSSPLPPVPPVPGPARSNVQAVVLGDSTAAADGNQPLPQPSAEDRACHRSADSYANDLAAANGWNVLNLACSSATVPAGLLGPQDLGSATAPAQLAIAKQATQASVVIVSVGADDLQWAALLRLCAITPTCNNQASMTYFQQELATFTTQYYQLLQQLAALPAHPAILINLYYNPFNPDRHCLDRYGLDTSKQKSLLGLLDALNKVLAQGAVESSFVPVQPSFTGHALCDPQPYVQGPNDPAPFHPTAAGELAIALADEHALQQPSSPSAVGAYATSPEPAAAAG